jgi:hypothetical protein
VEVVAALSIAICRGLEEAKKSGEAERAGKRQGGKIPYGMDTQFFCSCRAKNERRRIRRGMDGWMEELGMGYTTGALATGTAENAFAYCRPQMRFLILRGWFRLRDEGLDG